MRVILLAFATLLLAVGSSQAYESYKVYATRLVSAPPAGATFRPDLEAKLDALASASRRSNGRKGLTASTLLRTAARAQALDILKTGSVGHASARGDRFAMRFEAFAGDPDQRGLRGENVLRSRKVSDAAGAQASHMMKVWLGSSGHRRNLMAYDYRYVSTGVVQKGDTFYAVQMFWQK